VTWGRNARTESTPCAGQSFCHGPSQSVPDRRSRSGRVWCCWLATEAAGRQRAVCGGCGGGRYGQNKVAAGTSSGSDCREQSNAAAT
jgi:hypothetical protein